MSATQPVNTMSLGLSSLVPFSSCVDTHALFGGGGPLQSEGVVD